MTVPRHPFSPPTGVPSQAQLKAYAEGRLKGEEAYAVETHLENDPLLREAMEGLRVPGAAGALHGLEAHRPSSGSGVFTTWMIGGVVVAVLVGAAWWITSSVHPKDPLIAERIEDHQPMPEAVAGTEALAPAEIVAAVEIPETLHIGHARNERHTRGMQGQVARIEREATERIAPRTSATTTATDPAPPATPKGNVRTSRQLLFLHDLKVVHPQELYGNGPAMSDDPQNVLARYTDSSTQRTERADQRRVQYIAFMEDALGKFVRNDHKGCLEELRFLLQQYPDDVNALFYAGLCSYNLGMNERARSFLHRAATHSIDVFDEEATWYHALSLERLGETAAAQESFARIIARNGFYAERAQERQSGR